MVTRYLLGIIWTDAHRMAFRLVLGMVPATRPRSKNFVENAQEYAQECPVLYRDALSFYSNTSPNDTH